jgi:hypothetical protein
MKLGSFDAAGEVTGSSLLVYCTRSTLDLVTVMLNVSNGKRLKVLGRA